MSTEWLPFLLQTGDPLFPTGAYAHSFAMEEIVGLGLVRDEATLLDFLRLQIIPALENLELPLLRTACRMAMDADFGGLMAMNAEISAWKISRELREASLQLGTRRMQMLGKIRPDEWTGFFEGKEVHHLVACAVQMALGFVPLEATLAAYFYQTLAGYCGAALKLIRIGQDGAQRVLSACLEQAGASAAASMKVEPEMAGCFNPLLEIASMRHACAPERLFIS